MHLHMHLEELGGFGGIIEDVSNEGDGFQNLLRQPSIHELLWWGD